MVIANISGTATAGKKHVQHTQTHKYMTNTKNLASIANTEIQALCKAAPKFSESLPGQRCFTHCSCD